MTLFLEFTDGTRRKVENARAYVDTEPDVIVVRVLGQEELMAARIPLAHLKIWGYDPMSTIWDDWPDAELEPTFEGPLCPECKTEVGFESGRIRDHEISGPHGFSKCPGSGQVPEGF